MVLMDDIGWNNVDWHRAAANATTDPPLTPHMSSLVRNGIELTSHYAYQMCAPSRSAFQSGRSPLHVTLRNDDVVIPDAGVSPNMTGLGTLMKRAGYATHFYGKVILRCGCVLLDRRRDLCSSLPLLFSYRVPCSALSAYVGVSAGPWLLHCPHAARLSRSLGI